MMEPIAEVSTLRLCGRDALVGGLLAATLELLLKPEAGKSIVGESTEPASGSCVASASPDMVSAVPSDGIASNALSGSIVSAEPSLL